MRVELIYPPEDAEIKPKSLAELIGYTLLISDKKPSGQRRRVYIVEGGNDQQEAEIMPVHSS